MEFAYGEGIYIEGSKRIDGQIILSEHKLFLKGEQGDLAPTYIPLEKIEAINRSRGSVDIHVRPSLAYRYIATIKGNPEKINELTKDIVDRRGLKKKLWKNEWFEEAE